MANNDFDRNDRMDYPAGSPANDPLVTDRRTGIGSIGIMVAIALVLAVGMVIWGMTDMTNTTASNTAPGVTTGSSITTPSPANPPVKGPAESNPTR
jgi:hypothetical protein